MSAREEEARWEWGRSFDGSPVTDWHWSQDETHGAHLREGDCPFSGHSPCGPGGTKEMALYDFSPNTREMETGGALCVPGQLGLCF